MWTFGAKINGACKRVKEAVLNRDATFIQRLAADQTAAGAVGIDVNAGTPIEREPADLIWLVQVVEKAGQKPLCLALAR